MPSGRAALALSFAAVALAAARCDNTTCLDRHPDVGNLCLPAAVQANQTAVIEVQESCGLCSTQPQCDSMLIDGEVHIDLHAQLCNVRCTLPSLPEGDWPLLLPGNQIRLLRVR